MSDNAQVPDSTDEGELPASPNSTPTPFQVPSPPQYLVIADISAPFGLRGAVKANIQTDFPKRFARLKEVWLSPPKALEDAPRQKYALLNATVQNERQVVLRFRDITTIEQAEPLRGYTVAVPISEAVALPEGEFYIFQIIGLEVYALDGTYVGKVTNVEQLPANDLYIVRGPLSKKDVLIPAVKDVVKTIDLESGRMTIDLLDGLLP